jgi:protein TonB
METRFVLPLTVATALHVFVFFGVKWQHPPLASLVAKKPVALIAPQRIPLDLTPPEEVRDTDSGAVQPKGKPETPVSQEENFSAHASLFEQPPRPELPALTKMVHSIPTGPIGVLNGVEDVEWKGGHILGTDELDNIPRTRSQVAPTYPASERTAGISGEVLVEFTVDESGRVLNPRVVRSSHAAFESPTLRAVGKWRFEPGKKNGQTVRFRMMVPVTFNLGE